MLRTTFQTFKEIKSSFEYKSSSLRYMAKEYQQFPIQYADLTDYIAKFKFIEETRYFNPKKPVRKYLKGTHVVVCLHGLGGSPWDFMHLKNYIETYHEDIVVFCPASLEEETTSKLIRKHQ